jgi:heme transport system substrate-binding protein
LQPKGCSRPDRIWSSLQKMPGLQTVLKQIRDAHVRVEIVPSPHSIAGAQAKVQAIAHLVGREAEGERLAGQIAAEANAVRPPPERRVMFLFGRGGGVLNVARRQTAADAILQIVGVQNAVQDYDGYKPLTAESAVAAAPDYLLITTTSLEAIGGRAALAKLPGIAQREAGKNDRVVVIEDLKLLGFGPRTGEAVAELRKAFAR